MATVQHPAFETDTREIPDADAADWVAQGWIRTDAAPAARVAEVTEAPKPGPRNKK